MLRQSAGRTLSLGIRRESSMHNVHQPRGVTSERRHRASDQTSAVATPALQSHPVSARPSQIMRGVSWLGSAIPEGFAPQAQSIYPYELDLAEDSDAQAENAERPAVGRAAAVRKLLLLPGCSPRDIGIRLCRAFAPSHSPRNARHWF